MNFPVNNVPSNINVDLDALLPFIRCLSNRKGEAVAYYNTYELRSVYQPIFSLSHRSISGFEALIRIQDESGNSVSLSKLFDFSGLTDHHIFFDRLCCALHTVNFKSLAASQWLFLNIDPKVMTKGYCGGAFFETLFSYLEISGQQVVVEITENAIEKETELEIAANYFREQGCLIAVDDFGAGHSNFERIWLIEPEIVKLDRKLIIEATRRKNVGANLPGMVNLLHESGCIVIAEGIETEAEIMMMMEANVDLVQGYYLSHPASINDPDLMKLPSFSDIHDRYVTHHANHVGLACDMLRPYRQAFERTVHRIENGCDLAIAAREMLQLEQASRFYILNSSGMQTSHNINSTLTESCANPKLKPLSYAQGACWFHRPYFLSAINNPGEIQITQPYLSLPDVQMCYTMSIAIEIEGDLNVLCYDVAKDTEKYSFRRELAQKSPEKRSAGG